MRYLFCHFEHFNVPKITYENLCNIDNSFEIHTGANFNERNDNRLKY